MWENVCYNASRNTGRKRKITINNNDIGQCHGNDVFGPRRSQLYMRIAAEQVSHCPGDCERSYGRRISKWPSSNNRCCDINCSFREPFGCLHPEGESLGSTAAMIQMSVPEWPLRTTHDHFHRRGATVENVRSVENI